MTYPSLPETAAWLQAARAAVGARGLTLDRVSGGSATLEKPLTPRDSATSGKETSELAILAIPPPTHGRRVNVGMVNIGIIPATFRLSARSRSGQLVGRPVESGVPEDQAWVVNDAEHQLGVKLDETMTLRVTVIAGTGVAYASVAEISGDSQYIAAIPTQQQP
jgi:hypothetical protein